MAIAWGKPELWMADAFVVSDWPYEDSEPTWWTADIIGPVTELAGPIGPETRLLDIGCGNGYLASRFCERGARVVGVDTSHSGIEAARRATPAGRFEVTSATADLRERLGEAPFDIVISAEVVEHVFDPHDWAATCFNALRPGGRLVVTTPYHGYLKDLLLAITGRWDISHGSLYTGGHIKFFSRATLSRLLGLAGFTVCEFRGAGRFPPVWKCMVMSARRPDPASSRAT